MSCTIKGGWSLPQYADCKQFQWSGLKQANVIVSSIIKMQEYHDWFGLECTVVDQIVPLKL